MLPSLYLSVMSTLWPPRNQDIALTTSELNFLNLRSTLHKQRSTELKAKNPPPRTQNLSYTITANQGQHYFERWQNTSPNAQATATAIIGLKSWRNNGDKLQPGNYAPTDAAFLGICTDVLHRLYPHINDQTQKQLTKPWTTQSRTDAKNHQRPIEEIRK